MHLIEISRSVAMADNLTLPTPPPYAPELSPAENVRQLLRDNWLGDRIFAS